MRIFTVAAALIVVAQSAAADCYRWPLRKSRGAFAYDGDTVYITLPTLPAELSKMSIRLDGVDTPEIRGKCPAEKEQAKQARAFARQWLGAHQSDIKVCNPAWGKYAGRIVGHVKAGDKDLSDLLINAGLGRPYNGGKRKRWCPGSK